MQTFFSEGESLSSQYNFNYKLDFDKEGSNIELEADYNDYNSEEDADFDFTGNSPIENYEDFSDTGRESIIVNLDYVNPLTEST